MNAIIGWVAPLFFAATVLADPRAPIPMSKPESEIKTQATGSFQVKMTPSALPGSLAPSIARMTIDKQFQGDLEATSKGEMIAQGAGESKDASSVYVAIERVTGTLKGHQGTFVLVHRGTMNAGAFTLDVEVVPGSGTGQLAGLSGTMKIIIADNKHCYDFAYTLPSQH